MARAARATPLETGDVHTMTGRQDVTTKQDTAGRGMLRARLGDAGLEYEVRGAGHTSEVVILVEPSGERAMIGIWPDLLHTVPVPVADITAGDVVYFAGWREEFLPAMTKLTA